MDLFHSATLKAVRIHLDPFMDMASQETPFPSVHSNLQILSTESIDTEQRLLILKCNFRSAAALLNNSHISLHSLHEDLAQGRFGGRICLPHALSFPWSDGFGFAHSSLPEFVNYAHRRPGSVGMCRPCPRACLEPAFVRQMWCLTLGNFINS